MILFSRVSRRARFHRRRGATGSAEHRIPPLTFLAFTETRRRSAPTSRHSSRFAAVRVLRAIWRGYVSDKVHGDTWAVRTPKPTQRESQPGESQRCLEVPSSIISLIRRARAATLFIAEIAMFYVGY